MKQSSQQQQQISIQQSKIQFLEKDNAQLKHHIKDIEQSLKINKEIIDHLLSANVSHQNLQEIIQKLRKDNDQLYESLKTSYDERQAANTKILLLEQVSQQVKNKELESNNIYLDQILHLKQQLEKKQFLVESREKAFIDLYKVTIQRIPQSDKQAHMKIQDIIKQKQNYDMQIQNLHPASLSNIIQEKEKLQGDLERALNDIDSLKTLLAQNTIKSLYTQEDDDPFDKSYEYSTVTEGNGGNCGHDFKYLTNSRSDNKLSKSFSLGVSKKPRAKSKVPGLDFSNLKQVKDYKDWYSYSKKLEDAIRLLRERIKQLETENDELTQKVQKTISQCEQLNTVNVGLNDSLKRAKAENTDLKTTIDEQKNNYSFSKDDTEGDKSKQLARQFQILRKSKRNMSQATFMKRNLTLSIEEIEMDMQKAQQQRDGLATFNKKAVSDSQEDSPIREGDIV